MKPSEIKKVMKTVKRVLIVVQGKIDDVYLDGTKKQAIKLLLYDDSFEYRIMNDKITMIIDRQY